jgi:hypothetical protein
MFFIVLYLKLGTRLDVQALSEFKSLFSVPVIDVSAWTTMTTIAGLWIAM